MTSAVAWIDLEIIILSEVNQRKTNITYMWNLFFFFGILKNDINALIFKTEIDYRHRKQTWLPKRKRAV